jgi:hypothetical protein
MTLNEQPTEETSSPSSSVPADGDVVDVTYERPWLYPKQEHAIFYPRDPSGALARFSLIEAATKTGKTVGCIAWLFEQALFGKAGQNYWWVAPVYVQANIAYTRMKRAYPEGTFHSNDGDLILRINVSGTVIWFKSAEKPDNLYGEDVYAAVLDEASRMREESWHAIRSTITATRGPVRFIGNVKGRKNWFYALARKAESGEPGMAHFKIVASDAVAAGVLADQEIAEAKRDLPEQVFRELYLAEPSDDGGNPFGLAAIAACVKPMSAGAPKVWGWDLGKSVDWTVGTALDGSGAVCRIERFQMPWPEAIERIKKVTGGTPALVDSTGLGDPVVEMLQKRSGAPPQNYEDRAGMLEKVPGSSFQGYKFTSGSKQQLMEGLAVAIQSGSISFPDGVIRNELDDFEYEYTRTGVRYTAPEGFHDDCVCSLALAVMHRGHVRAPMVISAGMLQRASMPMRGRTRF